MRSCGGGVGREPPAIFHGSDAYKQRSRCLTHPPMEDDLEKFSFSQRWKMTGAFLSPAVWDGCKSFQTGGRVVNSGSLSIPAGSKLEMVESTPSVSGLMIF